jgi:hypothetical protein
LQNSNRARLRVEKSVGEVAEEKMVKKMRRKVEKAGGRPLFILGEVTHWHCQTSR